MKQQEYYMKLALKLAEKGVGHTSPNPMVGCVIVKDGQIIGEGYHEYWGGFHAERNALLSCQEDPKGADLYVNLEPCCHYGKTPPCTQMILEKKISKVYVGTLDPNPLMAGKGISILRENGVEVITGILKEECERRNEVFFHYIKTGRPFLAMKYAMTLDGKIAAASGDSKWVSGGKAREQVQVLRKQYSGILAGIGTVLADDPLLNVRLEQGVDPVRIILDSQLRIPLDSKISKTAGKIPTLLVCKEEELKKGGNVKKIRELKRQGAHIFIQPGEGRVNLNLLLKKLGEHKIDSVLVEGGSQIHGAFLEQKLIDKAYVYLSPKILGKSPYSPVEGFGVDTMKQAFLFHLDQVDRIGEDILLTAYPKERR